MWDYAKKEVKKEVNINDATDNLEDLYTNFVGPNVISQYFDTFYSLIINFKELNDNQKDLFVKLIFKSVCLLLEHLENILGDVNNYAIQDILERKNECKTLKLNIFVFCSLIDLLEKKDNIVNVKKKGEKEVKKTSFWEKTKDKSVSVLSKIFSMTLQWLFNPQVVEEDFVVCIMNVSWKLFENATSKDKEIIKSTTIIFGTGIEKYKQSFNFKNMVVNLLQNKENLVNNLINLIETITKEYHQDHLINEIIEEIYEIDKQILVKNAAGTKSISQFISDLSERCPKQFVYSVSNLILLLDDEPYNLRNGVLSAIGFIILNELSEENMSEEKKIIRNQLLDKLEDHIHDITSFTRGKAVSVWKRLCENSKIPISRIDRIVTLIVERLLDKASYVRKQAIQFLTVFIKVNQFTLHSSNDQLKEFLEKEKAKLDSIVKPLKVENKEKNLNSDEDSNQTVVDNEEKMETNDEKQDVENDENNDDENKENLDNTIIDEDFVPRADLLTKKDDSVEEDFSLLDYEKQKRIVKYLENCILISDQIKLALPRVFSIIYTKSSADIQEAIDFFVTAYEYEVNGSIDGVRKMLSLIFHSEKAIKDALKKAYLRIYMESTLYRNMTLKNKAISIAKNLTVLVEDATVGEVVSLEELLSQLMQENKIESSLIQVLWERFTKTIPNTTDNESQIAIHLISMLANSESLIIRQNLDTIIDHGLKDSENLNYFLVLNSCKALEKIVENRGKIDNKKSFRLSSDNILFTKLTDLILNHFCDLEGDGYIPMSCHIIKVIYLLSENPNCIAESLLRSCLKIVMNKTETIEEEENSNKKIINSELLSRFFYLLGEIAQNVMLFIEIDIATEIKKRNQLKTQKAECKTPKRKSLAKNDDENLADEMGLTGAAADEETEFLNQICNYEIVFKSGKNCNFLAEFASIVSAIASDPIKYSDLNLQTSVCVCLSKFMLVSEKFCKNHLRLLFTILEKTSESNIKINTSICCGDLCIRAPNLLDAWTPNLYLSLRSLNLNVRKASFKVISRLILADMVKVKEQISEIAKVIVDQDLNLSNMAKIFFVDLAKKNNNAIYNILPDVISNLSNEKLGVDEEKFKIINNHLFELIEKEKQTIQLTEKLCQRFKTAENEKEWSGLSFCLTLLNLNDKTVIRICENISCFSDKLVIDCVYDNFILLINNIKKTTGLKNTTKEILEEFIKKVEEFRNKGLEKENKSIIENQSRIENGEIKENEENLENEEKQNGIENEEKMDFENTDVEESIEMDDE